MKKAIITASTVVAALSLVGCATDSNPYGPDPLGFYKGRRQQLEQQEAQRAKADAVAQQNAEYEAKLVSQLSPREQLAYMERKRAAILNAPPVRYDDVFGSPTTYDVNVRHY